LKTRAAVLRKAGNRWEITERELDAPQVTSSSRNSLPKKYALDEINDGYQDLMDGKNIRGVASRQH